tara:strand:- start:5 stop:1066 length:1062 start_codon:yes stop_codon:yes gene_type:complete
MKLKHLPEDFRVEELIQPKLGEGELTYFWLTKKGWTTEGALRAIARAMRINYRRLKFAGTKDKHAISKQAVSAFKIPKERLEGLKIKDLTIDVIGTGEEPLSLGTLQGNKFTIVVRDVDNAPNATKVEDIKEGFLNLFGKQRFGRGNTHLIGKAIILGELEKACEEILCFIADNEFLDKKEFRQRIKAHWGKWAELIPQIPRGMHIEADVLKWLEHHPTDFAGAMRNLPKHLRRLYVHAYQSWIFNQALLQTPNAQGLLPVPGSKTVLGRDEFSQNVQKLLDKEGILLTDFGCERMPELRSEGDVREARVTIKDLQVSPAQPDDAFEGKQKVTVSFSLPKGCYATVLVEQLFS